MRHNFIIGIIEIFVVLFVILQCNTVYSQAIDRDYHIMELLILSTFALLIANIVSFGLKKKVLSSWLAFTFFHYIGFAVLALLSGIANEHIIYFAVRILIIFPIFTLIFLIYASNGVQYRLFDKFVSAMTVISAISLFFWLFVSILNIVNIKPTSYIYVKWALDYNYPNYFGVYVERQYENIFSLRLLRNQSIFCEAPMFSLCLVFAITLCISFSNKKANIRHKKFIRRKYVKLTIMVLALCSTLTTTGYIMLALILFDNYILNISPNTISKKNKILIIPLLFFIFIIFVCLVYSNKSDSMSWMVHLEDFKIGFKAWLSSPIFGCGFGNYDVLFSQFSNLRGSADGMSNSITVVLAHGGILLISFYIFPILSNAIHSLRRHNFGFLLFLVVFIVEFIFTVFQYTALMYFILAFLYSCFLESHHPTRYQYSKLHFTVNEIIKQ